MFWKLNNAIVEMTVEAEKSKIYRQENGPSDSDGKINVIRSDIQKKDSEMKSTWEEKRDTRDTGI